jgi:hypothetical protein
MEAIIDYDCGISYTPGNANIMTDALSHKSYCCELMVQLQQPLIYEELLKLNIKIVPHGCLNTLVVGPTLKQSIKTMQKYDTEVDKIKRYLATGKPSDFSLDNDGALFFKDHLMIPKFKDMPEYVMKEAHDMPLSIHPGSSKMYQDIHQRFWWSNMKQDIA